MNFKTAVALTFSTLPPVTEEALEARAFQPCGKTDLHSAGFVKPQGLESLVGTTPDNSLALICMQVEEKILPASVINRAVADKVAELVKREDRQPGRGERQEIKGEVIFELLPRAFSKIRRIDVIIDFNRHLIIVGGNAKQAGEVTTLLREALGSLPAVVLSTQQVPNDVMTEWLKTGLPARLLAGDYCKLEASDESGALHICRNQDPEDTLIRQHIDSGKHVVELGLRLGDLSFVLTGALTFKAMKINDLVLTEKLEDVEDKYSETMAMLILWAQVINDAIQTVTAAFGCYQQLELETSAAPSPQPTTESDVADRDLIQQAREIVVAEQRAGISMIQRRLRVGYNKAAALIESLEGNGIVSPIRGDGSREVLVCA